ncbi:RWP-RK domain containing protein [Hordeum vulgare]|nr:RWP-RK domain containing protein [Hordeum vulgare]
MEMQQYFGGGGDGDADWLHQLATLPPLPMSSSLPPPPLLMSEGSCLPMAAAAAAALPLGDCSSALMIRAEEQMGCLQMIPPPVVTDDVYSSYAPNSVDVLPPFPAGLDDPTAGLDDALLMDSFSDIDLEEFADAIGPKIKTEPLDDAMVPADYGFAAQAQQARPVVIVNQEQLDAPRGVRPVDDPDEDDSTVVAGGYEAAATFLYAEQKQVRPAPRRVRKSGGGGSRPAAAGKSLDHIGFEELRTYFYMPITKAAREMNVGLTVLKKRCRELGVARWPHRKMKSLRSLILNIQEMGKGATSPAAVQVELEALERYCARMEENPAIELTEQTKKLRQACFKENYKRRRAAASVNMLDQYCYNDLGSDEQMTLPQMGFFGF